MQGKFTKRQKEQARAQHRADKEAKRESRKRERAERPNQPDGTAVDPDIAGIVPGPQPPLNDDRP
jgi:hypothetical protein